MSLLPKPGSIDVFGKLRATILNICLTWSKESSKPRHAAACLLMYSLVLALPQLENRSTWYTGALIMKICQILHFVLVIRQCYVASIRHVQSFLVILGCLDWRHFLCYTKWPRDFPSVFILLREMPLSPGNLCTHGERAATKGMNKP